MNPSLIRRLTLVFFLVYLAALTFPGYFPFRHPTPLILGLPLSLVWVILWVLLGWGMLTLLYFVERRAFPPPPQEGRGENRN